MPTLLRKDGFKFFFYANEHLPKHMHIVKGDNFAKINLGNFEITKNYFNHNELKNALKILEENQQFFIEKWNEYFHR
ncbi:MAG: hypothetical protein A2068_07930 [Ignavibacteria bacterium GWB2_35_6b]|nr:MAG: hypothetical protein A2068_07930 [Ignavibacteria bacterium GWB2_35_6b]